MYIYFYHYLYVKRNLGGPGNFFYMELYVIYLGVPEFLDLFIPVCSFYHGAKLLYHIYLTTDLARTPIQNSSIF